MILTINFELLVCVFKYMLKLESRLFSMDDVMQVKMWSKLEFSNTHKYDQNCEYPHEPKEGKLRHK